MSKKNLLEESTIRGFMKLANLQPLTSKFLKETFEKVEEETNSDSVVCETDETLEEEMDGDELDDFVPTRALVSSRIKAVTTSARRLAASGRQSASAAEAALAKVIGALEN